MKSSEEHLPTVIPDESSEDEKDELNDEEEDEKEKKVRFNSKLLNESNLNPSLIE
jgi:hypothetical protein